MQAQGPCIQVSIGLAQAIAEQVLISGNQVPAPVVGLALIDTGASVTCIDDAVAQSLGLPVVDVAQMTSASHTATEVNIYPAFMQILGVSLSFNVDRAMGANLASQGLIALIGRDLLQIATLHYDGPAGNISLAL